jgi:molybdopterin-guanine dinucleotide biosynthesis protein A
MGVTAIILAGGKASRMGGDKALRLLRGRTLLRHAVDLVAELADETIISTGTRDLPMLPGLIAAPDAAGYAGQGPLAGVLAGLEIASHERAIVLACDLPNLPAMLLRRLVDTLSDACDCVYTEHAGHPEPLVAALNVAAAREAVREALSRGEFKVVPCWQSMAHRVLREADLAEFAPLEKTFANINTLADLEREARP